MTLIGTCYGELPAAVWSSQPFHWAAASGLHFYSDCADDGGRQGNASWTSIASVRAHWAHLRDLWEILPLPSILYSRLNLLPSGCLPRMRGKYRRGETSSLSFNQSVGRLAKKQPDTSPYLLFRTQHKSHCKSEPIVLVTNKETIIYIKFGRIKIIIFLRMQCYTEVGSALLSHSFHVQLASGVSLHLCVVFCSYRVINDNLSGINSNCLTIILVIF